MRQKHIKTHKSWYNMMDRCYNKDHPRFEHYGLRGIKVCKQWHDFKNFLKDMGPKPNGYSIERKNNNKGYSKSNCLWIPKPMQNKNQTRSVWITYKGRTQIKADWAREMKVHPDTLRRRLKRGWSVERALTP